MKKSRALTKSGFKQISNCARGGWNRVHHPELFTSDSSTHHSEEGKKVHECARTLFPNVECISEEMSNKKKIDETQRAISRGKTVIAEAAFCTGDLFCQVDILELYEDGVVINEVKGRKDSIRKTRQKDKIPYLAELEKDVLEDVAFQYEVLKRSGYTVNKVNIIHINPEYVYKDDFNVEEFFKIEDVTDEVKAYADRDLCGAIKDALQIMAQTEEPECSPERIVSGCKECELFDHCFGHLPKPNVFDIAGRFVKRHELLSSGVVTYQQLLDGGHLKNGQEEQALAEIKDMTIIKDDGIIETLNKVTFPVVYLDFESYDTAIPEFDGQWPYEQVPFQYSLDIIREPGGEIEHYEHLADSTGDPRRVIAEKLARIIPENASVIAYHAVYERDRILELADLYPDLEAKLVAIADSLVDIEIPFSKKHFYNKAMKGRSSIKLVLPALYPKDPYLDYSKLPGVKIGTEASEMFLKLRNMPDKERNKQRTYMLRYCNLDTFAMIKVHEALLRAVKNPLHKDIKRACDNYMAVMKDRYEEEDRRL